MTAAVVTYILVVTHTMWQLHWSTLFVAMLYV